MGVTEVIVIKSPAKLNLFLNIINKRNDGYHNIETYFQFVSLYDEISLNLISGNKIDFRCCIGDVAYTDQNIHLQFSI